MSRPLTFTCAAWPQEQLSFPEKYDRFIESLSPGMKMIYTCAPVLRLGTNAHMLTLCCFCDSMITSAITLMIITVVGGLVYFALERKLARALIRLR